MLAHDRIVLAQLHALLGIIAILLQVIAVRTLTALHLYIIAGVFALLGHDCSQLARFFGISIVASKGSSDKIIVTASPAPTKLSTPRYSSVARLRFSQIRSSPALGRPGEASIPPRFSGYRCWPGPAPDRFRNAVSPWANRLSSRPAT